MVSDVNNQFLIYIILIHNIETVVRIYKINITYDDGTQRAY